MTIRSVIEHVVDALGRGDPDPFVAMMADDAVLEFPLADDPDARHVAGKAAIAARMARVREVHDA